MIQTTKNNNKVLLKAGSKSAKNIKSNFENKNKYHLFI